MLAVPIVAIALSAIFWSNDKNYTVPPGSIDFRMCNTVLSSSPDLFVMLSPNLFSLEGIRPDREDSPMFIPVMFFVHQGPPPSPSQPSRSFSVDPETGNVNGPNPFLDDLPIREFLTSKRVEPIDSDILPWPYTDAVQIPARRAGNSRITYREPDPGAGIAAFQWAVGGDGGPDSQYVAFSNCRSQMIVIQEEGRPGHLEVIDKIQDDDRNAFARLRAAVQYESPQY